MAVTKGRIHKLEKRISLKTGFLVIPLLSSPEQAEAIRKEAARLGKKTIGIPVEIAKKNGIELWNPVLNSTEKEL